MRIQITGDTLRVSEIAELVGTTTRGFQREVRDALTKNQRNIEVDLSETVFLDSCGLGVLIALYKEIARRNGHMRLANPQPPVMQVLELTRMHRLFEISNRSAPVTCELRINHPSSFPA